MRRPPYLLSLRALILMTKRQLLQWATVVILFALATGIAYLTTDMITQHWYGYINYESPYLLDLPPTDPMPGPSRRLVIVVIDSLHRDAYEEMASWQEMKALGSYWEMEAGQPSHSLPAWATLVTGADAAVHGVITGLHTAPLEADNIVSSAGRAGYETIFAGNRNWEILLGDEFDRARYELLPDIDDPGPEPDRRSVGYIIEELGVREEGLFILNLSTLKQASLTAGVTSAGTLARAYLLRVTDYDEMLLEVMDALDFSNDTLMFVVSHGTMGRGAAGGGEPEVVDVAAVMAGRGITPDTGGEAHNRDIASTAAVLLGTEIPVHATGVPLLDALDVGADEKIHISTTVLHAQHRMFGSTLAQGGRTLYLPEVSAPDQLYAASSSYRESVRDLMDSRAAEGRGARILHLLVPLAAAIIWLLLLLRTRGIRVSMIALLLALVVGYGLLLLMGARFSLTDVRDAMIFPVWYRGLRAQGILVAAAVGMLSGLMIAKGGDYTLPRLFAGTLQSIITTVLALMIPVGAYMYLYGNEAIWTPPPQSLWMINYATVVFVHSISQFALLALAMGWLGAILTVNWWLD